MLKILSWMVLVISFALPSPAGQQPGGVRGGEDPMRSGPDVPELESLTVDISGDLLQVDTERNAVQIRTKKSGKIMGLLLDRKCKIKADKKQFAKKDLTLAELEPGYQVEMTVRREDLQVLEMKVKKPKEKPAGVTDAPPKG